MQLLITPGHNKKQQCFSYSQWDELKKVLTPDKFNLQNMRKRLEKEGDLWKGIFDKRIDLAETLKEMNNA